MHKYLYMALALLHAIKNKSTHFLQDTCYHLVNGVD